MSDKFTVRFLMSGLPAERVKFGFFKDYAIRGKHSRWPRAPIQQLHFTRVPPTPPIETMVINPTYLAQKTRSCMTSICSGTNGEKDCRLITRSVELAGRTAEGDPCLPAMAEIS